MRRDILAKETSLSIVIPVFNEKEGLQQLRKRLLETIESWRSKGWNLTVEIVLIDDGSTDGSREIMDKFSEEDSRFKVIHLSRNFGHQEALSAGLVFSTGDCIAVLDADLQDPPELIGTFLENWASGIDIVYGVRKNRKEGIFKRASYAIFYRMLRRLANTDIPLDSGDFCLMDRKVVDVLNHLPEKIRFVRGLRSWTGFKQYGVEYDRDERRYGEPKYTFRKLVRLAFTGLFGFSTIPLRVATTIGFITMLLGFILAAVMIIMYFGNITFLGHKPSEVAGFTSLFSGLMIFSGFQLLALGIIGEYIGMLYFETKGRPNYVIDYIAGKVEGRNVPFGIGPVAPHITECNKKETTD
jgi:dolichol-phosphate mannosyltransferase